MRLAMNEIEHARNQLVGARERVSELDEAAKALTDDTPFAAVEKLSTSLTIAEARVQELEGRVERLQGDEAKAAEEAMASDAAGLLAIYRNNNGRVAHLPAALRRKVLEAHRREGEAALMRGGR